jgi:hypothetical protein
MEKKDFEVHTTKEINLRRRSDEDDEDSEKREQTDVRVMLPSEPVDTLPLDIRGSLCVIEGAQKGKKYSLELPYNSLGRSLDSTIVINDSFVSSQHAIIYFTKSMEWRIRDLGSTNGTLLNGSRVKEFALRSGDKILLGDHLLSFTVERH